jgi:hypothetical protein
MSKRNSKDTKYIVEFWSYNYAQRSEWDRDFRDIEAASKKAKQLARRWGNSRVLKVTTQVKACFQAPVDKLEVM